jgi:hypothetical protein
MGFLSDVLNIAVETVKTTDEALGIVTKPVKDVVKDIRREIEEINKD